MSALAAVLVLGSGAWIWAAGTVAHTAHAKRVAHRSFKVKGNLRLPLRPGSSQRIKLRLTNRRRFTLWITRLKVRVSVDRAHRAAGCSAKRDFAIRQLPRRAFPFGLRKRSTRSLKSLGIHALPRIRMRNLPRNQDACKGARLRLRYRGRARKTRPRGPHPRGGHRSVGTRTP